MTPQEAIERLRKIPIRPKPDNALDLQAICIAKKALEKQIPKKPIEEEMDNLWNGMSTFTLSCPHCSKQIINVWSRADYRPHYCSICGQALDWSDIG